MHYSSADAPRTGERNVNLDKNTSENAAWNKIICMFKERWCNKCLITIVLRRIFGISVKIIKQCTIDYYFLLMFFFWYRVCGVSNCVK